MEKSCLQNRIIGLDILRIYAVISIFLFHSNLHLKTTFGILTGYISNGAVAMILFFMLSGFVLHIKYETVQWINKKELFDFYKKRILGLYPLYLTALLIWGIVFVRDSFLKTALLLPIEILGLHGFFETLYGEWNNSGTWFVSCLLCCYFLYPFLSMVLSMLNKKHRHILLFVLYLISSISPVSASILNCNWIYPKPVFRLLEFMIGMLLVTEVKEMNTLPNKLKLGGGYLAGHINNYSVNFNLFFIRYVCFL